MLSMSIGSLRGSSFSLSIAPDPSLSNSLHPFEIPHSLGHAAADRSFQAPQAVQFKNSVLLVVVSSPTHYGMVILSQKVPTAAPAATSSFSAFIEAFVQAAVALMIELYDMLTPI